MESVLELHRRLEAVRSIDSSIRVFDDYNRVNKEPLDVIWCHDGYRAQVDVTSPMTRDQAVRHRAVHLARVQDLVVIVALDVARDVVKVLAGSVVIRARRLLGGER